MEFRTGVIRPIECFREGWQLIKDQFWLYFAMTLLGMIIGGAIPFGIFLGVFFCGLYYPLMLKTSGQKFQFGDMFKGFDVFVASLVPTLIWFLPMMFFFALAYIPLIVLQLAVESKGKLISLDENTMWTLFGLFSVFLLLGGLVGATLHAFIIFAYPLIMEKRVAGGWAAFRLSSRAAWANLSGVVGLIACQIVLGIVGYMLCFVGLYLMFPIMFAGVFTAYRKVFPALGDQFAPSSQPPAPPQFVNNSQWQ